MNNSAYLVQEHPDNSIIINLFSMSGTSMVAAEASGVAALILEANPDLSPDQVKYRMMHTARPALSTEDGEPQSVFNVFRQEADCIWASDAVFGEFSNKAANNGMDITADGTCSDGYSWSGGYSWGSGHSWSCGYSWSGRYSWPGGYSWSGGTENSRWVEK